jgi:UDP-N-acetylglucosamine 2-epimerase
LIVDVCRRLSEIASKEFQSLIDDLPSEYLLLTIHRPENSDDPIKLEMLRKHLEKVRYKVIFPVHPRTKNNLARFNIKLPPNVIAIAPAGYLQFLYLLKNCKLVLTDSGGVQEEAIVLRKPCITLRHTSARWETILLKANILFPLDRNGSLNDVIESMIPVKISRNPYGNNVAKATMRRIEKL